MAGVDVLAVMQDAASDYAETGCPALSDDMLTARAAVVDLIEMAKLVNADHTAPHDCYATGPRTGNPIADLVACPGCFLKAAIANCGGTP